MSELRLEYLHLSSLTPADKNPKRHALEPLSRSINRFGYVEPIILDERTGKLVAGHGRRETLLKLRDAGEAPPAGVQSDEDGAWLVPVVRGWESKSDADAEAYLLASNRHVELGGWDNSELAALLQSVDLEGTGFTPDDVFLLLDAIAEPVPLQGDPDEIPEEPDDSDIYVQPGDLWQLGDHRLLCADCTVPENVSRVLDGQLADICVSDAPYNVAIGKKSERHDDMANDDLGDAFPGFCAAFAATIKSGTKPGAPLYLAMSSQEWPTIDSALRNAGFHWSTTIIWAKDTFVLSRGDFHRQYEPLWYGWNADAPRLHPVEDRKQSDLWQIPRPKKSESHPSIKPVELVARALTLSSNPRDLVLEIFAGSGTTIIAAEQTGRRCAALELSPRYAQVCIERWQMLTGKKAEKLGSAS